MNRQNAEMIGAHLLVPPWKRTLDLAFTSCALVLLSPVLLVVAVAVRIFLGSPVLFRQQRPGIDGRPFTIYKFRTMKNAEVETLSDAHRMTQFGIFLRRTSLDELPELWNVLRGEMSLVGPRPLLTQYLPRYSREQQRRHEVLPGITGLAQINGRNAISWQERFALDLWYVDHQSFWLDLKILFLTVVTVFRGNGIERSGFATMPEFMGCAIDDSADSNPQVGSRPSLVNSEPC